MCVAGAEDIARLGYQQWLARHFASAPNPALFQAMLQQAAVAHRHVHAGSAAAAERGGCSGEECRCCRKRAAAAATAGRHAGVRNFCCGARCVLQMAGGLAQNMGNVGQAVHWVAHAQGFPGMMPFPFGAPQQQQQQQMVMMMQQQAAAAAAAMFAAGAASSGCARAPCY